LQPVERGENPDSPENNCETTAEAENDESRFEGKKNGDTEDEKDASKKANPEQVRINDVTQTCSAIFITFQFKLLRFLGVRNLDPSEGDNSCDQKTGLFWHSNGQIPSILYGPEIEWPF
jgi:hypothetical protein